MEDLPGKESKTFERYIARRLILFILVCSSVITLISTSARLYLEYRNDMESIENNMHQIELSASTWLVIRWPPSAADIDAARLCPVMAPSE